MQGLHLTADLRGCSHTQAAMTEPAPLRELCLRAVREAGLQPVGELFHRFTPASGAAAAAPTGVTGVVLLAESHLAVHTWPELGAVTIDVYVCNFKSDNSGQAQAALEHLVNAFGAREVARHALQRGGVRD